MVGMLLGLAALMALYWILRYGGLAIEGDAVRLSLAAEGTLVEGRLVPQRMQYPAHSAKYFSTLLILSRTLVPGSAARTEARAATASRGCSG